MAPRLGSNEPVASDLFQPISVEPAGRASNFKVAWTGEGSRVKILFFTTGRTAIEAGQGPILRVCYSVAADTPEGRYPMLH